MELNKRVEVIGGLALLALILAGCLLVVAPFVSSLLWAAIICFSTWPLHRRLDRLCGRSRTLAAALMTLLIIVVTVLPFVVVAMTLTDNLPGLIKGAQELRAQGIPPPPAWLRPIPMAGEMLHSYWADLSADGEKGFTLLATLLDQSKVWLLHRSRDLGVGVVHLCISVFIAFFFYRDGEHLVARVGELSKRVLGEQSQHLVNVVGGTIRGVVYGFLGTAMAQGMLAALGFTIARVPYALLLGLLTFLLALVPFGPPLVWIPAAIWLFLHGHPVMAIFLAIWGTLVISGVDNFLRPYLISREAQLPFVLVFLGALGGILAFGFIGLFLGPTLLAVGFAILNDFLHHAKSADTRCPPEAGGA
jgi:predicted PurR-regulated permease PerM